MYPITIGTWFSYSVLSMRTASLVVGFDVVVAIEVVEVTVGEISSHSYESHGHPPGQLSLMISLLPLVHTFKIFKSINHPSKASNYKKLRKNHLLHRGIVLFIRTGTVSRFNLPYGQTAHCPTHFRLGQSRPYRGKTSQRNLSPRF